MPGHWSAISRWPTGLAERSRTDIVRVSRAEVVAALQDVAAREDWAEALVASYVWGQSRTGFGPHRLEEILASSGLADALKGAAALPRPLTELRARWRTSAVRAVGTDVVDRLLQTARAAAAAVWARVRPVVDLALAASGTVAVVYVMRGAFQHRHLLAEARRHLAHTLRGIRHEPGLDDRIVQAAIDNHTRRINHALTADFASVELGHRLSAP